MAGAGNTAPVFLFIPDYFKFSAPVQFIIAFAFAPDNGRCFPGTRGLKSFRIEPFSCKVFFYRFGPLKA